MTEKKNKKTGYVTDYTDKKEWSDKDTIELIKEENFSDLKNARDKLAKLFEKQIGDDREKTKMVIKSIDDSINLIINTRIRTRMPISEEMRNFVSYKFETNSNSKTSDKNVTEIIKNFEDELKIKDNLLRVTTKKLLMYKSRSRIKLFHYTDDELEEIADKCRMRNGKLNLSKMGRVVGADPDTVKNEIGRRNLTYLHNSSKK